MDRETFNRLMENLEANVAPVTNQNKEQTIGWNKAIRVAITFVEDEYKKI